MHPLLIDFGTVELPFFGPVHLALPSYGLFVATAVIVAWLWFTRRAMHDGIDADAASQVAFWTLLGGLGGGKLGLLVVEAPYYLAHPGEMLSMNFVQAAGVVWAAVIGGAAAMLVSSWRGGLPIARLLDAAAVTIPVGQAIGRVGCLMAGCCFGGRCAAPWAITYFSREAARRTGVPLGVALHPTPIYEILWSLGVVLPLTALASRKRRNPGEAALVYFAAYSVGRFAIEFFRGDSVRGLWFGGTISTSQLISLIIAPLAVAGWLWLRRRDIAAEERPAIEELPSAEPAPPPPEEDPAP